LSRPAASDLQEHLLESKKGGIEVGTKELAAKHSPLEGLKCLSAWYAKEKQEMVISVFTVGIRLM
jgi:hypothetical protein